MDFQSCKSKEQGQRLVGDPDLGKERTKVPHKKDLAKENSNNSVDPFTFLYRLNENIRELPKSFYLVCCFYYPTSFFLSADDFSISQSGR